MKKYIFILIALLFAAPCVGMENGEESEATDITTFDNNDEELNEEEDTEETDEDLHEEDTAPKQNMITLSAETIKALRE